MEKFYQEIQTCNCINCRLSRLEERLEAVTAAVEKMIPAGS